MRSSLSSWWYAVPLVIAGVVVVASGVVVGTQAAGAARQARQQIDQIERLTDTGLRLTLSAGEQRVIAVSSPVVGDLAAPRATCEVVPTDGQQPPVIEPYSQNTGSGPRLQLNGRTWWPVYRVHAVETGGLDVQCTSPDRSTQFAVGPDVRWGQYASFGWTSLVAVLMALVLLLVAATVAGVLLVLQRAGPRRDAHGSAPPRP